MSTPSLRPSIKEANFLRQAKTVYDHVYNSVETPHKYRDITNPNLPPLSDIVGTTNEIGEKKAYKLYLLLAERDRIRSALKFGEKESKIVSDYEKSPTTYHLFNKIKEFIIGTMGVGDVSETSFMSWFLGREIGASMKIAIASIQNKKVITSHHFVILHPENTVIKEIESTISKKIKKGNYSTTDVLNNLPPDCVVMDVAAKVCCLAKNLNAKGKKFLGYIENNNLKTPLFCNKFEKDEKGNEINLIIECKDKGIAAIQENLKNTNYSHNALFFEFAEKYKNSSLQALQEAFSGTIWKSKIDNKKLSFLTKCNQEQLEQISERLEIESISFNTTRIKEGEYLVSIPDGYCIFKGDEDTDTDEDNLDQCFPVFFAPQKKKEQVKETTANSVSANLNPILLEEEKELVSETTPNSISDNSELRASRFSFLLDTCPELYWDSVVYDDHTTFMTTCYEEQKCSIVTSILGNFSNFPYTDLLEAFSVSSSEEGRYFILLKEKHKN